MKKILLLIFTLFLIMNLQAIEVKNVNSYGGNSQGVNDKKSAQEIEQTHQMLEDGKAFHGWNYWADLDTPQGVTVCVVVPDGVTIHVRMAIRPSSQALTWNLYKLATSIDASGTTPTTGNKFATHSNTKVVNWYIDPEAVGGTKAGEGGYVSATNQTGGSHDPSEEVNLGAGIHYWWFVPIADNGVLGIDWFWYNPDL